MNFPMNFRFATLGLCALALAGTASAQVLNNKQVNVTQLDDGRQIRLTSGQMLRISLPAQPSTGYSWYIVEQNPSQLQQVGPIQFLPSHSAVGSRGTQVLTFRAMSGGSSKLRLAYGRQWETSTGPIDRFMLLVSVDQAGMPDSHRVDERWNHKDVTIEVNDILIVQLDSNPSSGYQWSLTRNSPFILEFVGDDYIPPRDRRAGTMGKQVFTFRGKRSGTVSLSFAYTGPDRRVPKTFDINVRVVPVANPRPQPGWPGVGGPGQNVGGGKGQGWGIMRGGG